MQEFDNIKDMVYCEIDEISRRDHLDINTIQILGELVDILKDIASVETFEEGVDVFQDNGSSYGYSRNGNNMNGYSQKRMPVYYNDGTGYRNGMNSRRGNRNYSYDDSKKHMVNKLHELMMDAHDQKDKDAIQRLIDQMEN